MRHIAGTGVYCFQDLPFVQRSAMAASAGFFAGELDVVTNVSVTYSGPDCPDSFTKRTTRVLMWDIGLSAPGGPILRHLVRGLAPVSLKHN